MTLRLTSSSRAGTTRVLVAVGTARLASMLAAMRAAAPRRGRTPGVGAAGRRPEGPEVSEAAGLAPGRGPAAGRPASAAGRPRRAPGRRRRRCP